MILEFGGCVHFFWSGLCNAEGYLYSIDIFTAKFSTLAYGELMYKVE